MKMVEVVKDTFTCGLFVLTAIPFFKVGLLMQFLLVVVLLIQEISKQIEGHTICALGDGAAWPVQVYM